MPAPATFETFSAELSRLVVKFENEFKAVTDPGYLEARLRDDYLNPLIRALGWDLENHAGLIQIKREIEIESRTDVAGRAKRADYLFRTDGKDRQSARPKSHGKNLDRAPPFKPSAMPGTKRSPLPC